MSKKEENKPPNKKLILHFDVANTIILEDRANRTSKDVHLHEMLASQAWGQLEQKDAKSPIQWKLQYNHFSVVQPEKDLLDYKSYVDSLYPLKDAEEEPNEDNRKIFNTSMKANRANLYGSLVKTGGPGLKLKPEYDKITKSVALPRLVNDYVSNELQREEDPNGQNGNPGNEEEKILDLLGDGRYFILPSFFRMMTTLKKAKREFAIVFRSFNSDLSDVIREMNAFCAGEHPCFNGRNNTPLVKFDGSKNNKNFKIKQFSQAVCYRNQTSDIEQCSLAVGTLVRKDRCEQHKDDPNVRIIQGTHAIHALIQQLLKESCAIGIQDDLSSWSLGEKKASYAKPLIVDQTDYLTQHIFLSDLVSEEEDECGVDVRDGVTGESLPVHSTINKYIAKVETIEAVRNPDYFLKLIEVCEKNRAEDIERTERPQLMAVVEEQQTQLQSGGDVPVVPVQKSEFQLLMEAPSDVYLRSTILPLLSAGLRICDTERPQDPIAFLAGYILKNKERVKIPQPPLVDPQDAAAAANANGEEDLEQQAKDPNNNEEAPQK